MTLIHRESHSHGRWHSAENALAPSSSDGDVAFMTPRPLPVTSSLSRPSAIARLSAQALRHSLERLFREQVKFLPFPSSFVYM